MPAWISSISSPDNVIAGTVSGSMTAWTISVLLFGRSNWRQISTSAQRIPRHCYGRLLRLLGRKIGRKFCLFRVVGGGHKVRVVAARYRVAHNRLGRVDRDLGGGKIRAQRRG